MEISISARLLLGIVGVFFLLFGHAPTRRCSHPTFAAVLHSSRSSLAEIDISKAYTGAFIRIKSIPVFNEFDAW
ncbi:MAG: hypothetical protein ACKPKO_63055, partial [Candidatus Fonsibacter sp.]